MFPLIILAGPTASGKSKLAIELAEHFDTEIISADSMQLYRHFDIGTAKPSREERDRVPHHLIDILEPEEAFTAFDFKERALSHIRDLRAQQKTPLLVGGTGLYLKTLLENYDCAVPVEPDIRQQVQEEILLKGVHAMHEELVQLDPGAAEKIEPGDPIRVERALSVYRQTGKPFSEFHSEDEGTEYEFDIQFFLLECERQTLYSRIETRVDQMIEQGLQREVEDLLSRGTPRQCKPFQGIGYAQMVRHLDGEIPLDRAVYEIKRDTRRYAKRQITWFKKTEGAQPLTVEEKDTSGSLKEKVLSHLSQAAALSLVVLLGWLIPMPVHAQGTDTLETATRLYESGRYDQAQAVLDQLLKTDPTPDISKRSRYLRARILIERKHFPQAAEALQGLLPDYPEMEDYIRFDLANALRKKEQWQPALEQVSLILKNFKRTRLEPAAGLLRAELLQKLDRNKEALKQLQDVERRIRKKFRSSDYLKQLPKILYEQGKLNETLGEPEQAYKVYRKLYVFYPTHALAKQGDLRNVHLLRKHGMKREPLSVHEKARRIRALLNAVHYKEGLREIRAMKRELKKGEALPPRFHFYMANAYQGQRQRARANRALKHFIRTFPKHKRVMEAQFQIGRNLWNLGNPLGGAEHFKMVANDKKDSRWKEKAHFYLARIYEDVKDYDASIRHFTILADEFRNENYTEASAWRIGWLLLKRDRFQKAFDRFKKNTKQFPDGILMDKNLFWMAKMAERLNRQKEAQTLYEKLARSFPFTYYGLLARYRFPGPVPHPFEPDVTQGKIKKAAYQLSESNPISLGRRLSKREQFHFVRARELVALRRYPAARKEILQVARTVRKNLTGVLWLAHWYNQTQAFSDTLRLMQLYKNFKTKQHEKDLSRNFWLNFYPPAYAQSIAHHSRKHKVDPLLVRSLIRQESMYDRWSLSQAGARGLMQIMPKTGRRLHARETGSRFFDKKFLFDPEINIRLGTRYISELSRRYRNNPHHILISYNAGPKVLRAWLQRFRNLKDSDIFVESIPYPETRKYVKYVMRNYEIYKILYAEKDPPPPNKPF